MARPFFNIRIDELEAVFDRRRTDPEFLQQLIDELLHQILLIVLSNYEHGQSKFWAQRRKLPTSTEYQPTITCFV